VEFKNVFIPSEGEDKDRVKEIVSMTAKHFEEGIRHNPQDWHMLQRIWTDGDFKERQ
jgi:KDO2-lipid IV(A) lauroyltransferase